MIMNCFSSCLLHECSGLKRLIQWTGLLQTSAKLCEETLFLSKRRTHSNFERVGYAIELPYT